MNIGEYSFRKLIGFVSLAGLIALCGCQNPTINAPSGDAVKTNKSATTYVVTVGMENSAFAGSCPGAGIDAVRMTEKLRSFSDNVVSFSSATAKKADVVKAITEAVSKSELFIFYYSGHGGSDKFWDTGSEEVDGKDEYYCLYDTYLRDNEMWQMISKAKGRVVLINDCCHSKTIFRQPCNITLKGCIALSATSTEDGNINMQCWSGCPDDTYSYGSSSGGKFTNTLLKYLSDGETYDSLWQKIENDKSLQLYEKVQRTKMGTDFGCVQMFK